MLGLNYFVTRYAQRGCQSAPYGRNTMENRCHRNGSDGDCDACNPVTAVQDNHWTAGSLRRERARGVAVAVASLGGLASPIGPEMTP